MRVGLLWRGDPAAPAPTPAQTRFRRIFEAFADREVRAEPVVYDDAVADRLGARMLELDAVLVWVDPIVRGQDRRVLDALLRDVAASGVVVSAHPDVIDAMGTKEILYRTKDLPWGTDTHLYGSLDALRDEWPAVLRSSGPRVLKQDRGSGGNGVWRVELIRDGRPFGGALVRVQSAARGAPVEEMHFADFVEQRRAYLQYFAGRGTFVDQPYCGRLAEGMTRCYMARDRVAGFGHQLVTALLPPPGGAITPPDPEPRRYYGPEHPEFQRLRQLMDSGWIALLLRAAGLRRASLPAIWDADFLLGPRAPTGEDTYVLCEINVSGVYPIPDESVPLLVDTTIDSIRQSAAARFGLGSSGSPG